MKAQFSGSCACGAITYAYQGEPMGMGHCYCRDCQRASGTSHAAVMVVPAVALSISGDTPKRFEQKVASGATVYRSFCRECGTPLFAGNTHFPAFVSIKVGSLDDPNLFQPAVESWTDSAPNWAIMSPKTQKFAKNLPGVGEAP